MIEFLLATFEEYRLVKVLMKNYAIYQMEEGIENRLKEAVRN